VKLLIFGGGFFILLAERGVVPKEGLRMVSGRHRQASGTKISTFIR
jgi:hypothetical protein